MVQKYSNCWSPGFAKQIPAVRGCKVPVRAILSWGSRGSSEEDTLQPQLSRLQWAAQSHPVGVLVKNSRTSLVDFCATLIHPVSTKSQNDLY